MNKAAGASVAIDADVAKPYEEKRMEERYS